MRWLWCIIKKGCLNIIQTTFSGWAHLGLNQGPPDYESGATNQLSYRPRNITISFYFCPARLHWRSVLIKSDAKI